MKLKQLLKQLPKDLAPVEVKGSKEIEITGITANSQQILPGNLFIAKKGATFDGTRFIQEAFKAGAVAALTDMYDPSLKGLVQIICEDVVRLEAYLAAAFYEHPSDSMWMVGITGTNGKTTTTYAARHILEACGITCGLIGSIEYIVGKNRYISTLTTPDVCRNHKLLREMRSLGCSAAVCEVSSHALDQGRVAYIHYDVAVVTNLNHEHLDYHGSMESYFQAKARLLQELGSDKVALVNADDPWADRFIAASRAKVLTFGIENNADIQAKQIQLSVSGSRFIVSYRGEEQSFSIPLVGRFNVYNALAATGVALTRGIHLKDSASALASFPTVSGRLEPVVNPRGLHIFVDHAHKPVALQNVLQTLKEVQAGRIITVFGCGGDRDRQKRPLMAQISEEFSDITIVTSDNPRSESPQAIVDEIVSGFARPQEHIIELDRRKAIRKAVELAKPGDIILIAGKGHETQQIIASRSIDFDDRIVAGEAVATL
ncbi:MAG: UDP-N-acetylmuramoyl-L-alanyl-D-glutamate--2,6-diaminopimelate ligase [Verrucomicrobia bacterium]|nr:UDP-N-acetylmuramoyl-L-alanyl-D-glutamate--2,6-diaminopimelate ligase [Verrucomicrobiota bacterium]